MRLSRRACFCLAAAASCTRPRKQEAKPAAKTIRSASSAGPGRAGFSQRGWHELPFVGRSSTAPKNHALLFNEGHRAPLLLALHGAGEAAKGPLRGARGWRDDYHLDRTLKRLKSPPLLRSDFHGFVSDERLRTMNADLQQRPYRGLHILCPYAPRLKDRSLLGVEPYAQFLTKRLLPRVKDHLAEHATSSVGLDGVSMGGRLALIVGLGNPQIFASVAALQPAIGEDDIPWLCKLAKQARERRPGLHLRLVTSRDDYFRRAVRAFSEQLRRLGVAHDFLLTPGPHDYAYNRGPGGYEMLLYHERVLRGEQAV